jgi:hypothetical protein
MLFMGAMLQDVFGELSPLTKGTVLSFAVGLYMVSGAQFN